MCTTAFPVTVSFSARLDNVRVTFASCCNAAYSCMALSCSFWGGYACLQQSTFLRGFFGLLLLPPDGINKSCWSQQQKPPLLCRVCHFADCAVVQLLPFAGFAIAQVLPICSSRPALCRLELKQGPSRLSKRHISRQFLIFVPLLCHKELPLGLQP